MGTLDSLISHGERVRAASDEACEASRDLARAANGNSGHVVPGPVAYDLLGNLKVLLWSLREVAEFMPTGVANSLSDERIVVYDRGPEGDDRDPKEQLIRARAALEQMASALADAAACAEAAQGALNGQGWRSHEEESRLKAARSHGGTS